MTWSPTPTEAPAVSPRLARVLPRAALLSAAIVAGSGAAALVGWAADVWWLRDPVGGFAPMVPNAAVMLILAGASLALSVGASARRRWAARVLAAVGVALALTILAQDVVGRDFGVDRLLFDAPALRPAIPTTIALLVSSTALLALDLRVPRGPTVAEILATLAGAIGWLTLGAFLLASFQFYAWSRAPHAAGMAVNTAAALIALALGIVLARPESGAMAAFTSRHVGGQAARRVLPIVLTLPAVAYLAVRAERAGFYPVGGDAVVECVAAMVVAVVVTLATARSLDRVDARRRELEALSREWRRFFERATFGAGFGTLDGRFGLVNDAFARMLGYDSPAELLERPIEGVFPPERRAELLENIRLAHERGRTRWESELVRRDGSMFPILIDSSAVRDEEGHLLYRATIVQDMTEEKKAEQVRARLASLVQSSGDAILVQALDGTVLDWNRGAERVYGWSAAEMVGRRIDAIVPEDRRGERAGLQRRALAGEMVVGFETERVRKDGARIPISLTLSPILDPAGRVVGVSTIGRDISVLKQMEREREEWAAIVAHDLRQPAGAISLVASMLARNEGEPAKQKAIERIRCASERLERMISDLLDVSRVAAGRLALTPEDVDLTAVLAEAVELVPDVAARCRMAVDPDAAHARGDAGRLVQVLANLLSNAQKYGDPGTPVDVQVEPVGCMVQVSVTNEGPGIPDDEIPKLFSRFTRTSSAMSGGVPGLGLGLYICRGIVEALGGRLWVESAPGDRTHFRFTLPAAPASPAERAPWAAHAAH